MSRNIQLMGCCVVGALVVVLTQPAFAGVARIADSNTVLLWHMDEAAPNTVPDGSDLADAGTLDLNGTTVIENTYVQFGQAGNAGLGTSLYMAGNTTAGAGYRNTAYNSNLSSTALPAGDFTAEAWIKNPGLLSTANSTRGRIIVGRGSSGSTYDWTLGLMGTDAAPVLRVYTGSTALDFSMGSAFSADTWYYLSLVVSGTSYTVYAAQEGDTAVTSLGTLTAAAPTAANTYALAGGYAGTSANLRFQGNIDEVQFSNVARDVSYLNGALIPEPTAMALLFVGGCMVIGKKLKR